MIFKLQGELILDKNKPTIGFIDKGAAKSYTHIYGAARILKEKLQEQYNIITIGAGCKLQNNYYEINRNVTKPFLRKHEDKDYLKKNYTVLDKSFKKSFENLPELDYLILGTDDFFRLPLTTYASIQYSDILRNAQNEYFDYIGSNEKILNEIDELNDYIIKDFDRLVCPYAFSTCDYSLFMRCCDVINRMGKLKHKVIGFTIDPAMFKPFFDKLNIPNEFLYFADDKRGTRDYTKFDIGQFQHIIYDNRFLIDDWDDINKTRDFFFAGTIFQDKGSRQFLWDEFLKDVDNINSSFYIPLRRNGINKSNDGRAARLENILKESQFKKLYDEIIQHPLYKGSLLPSELNSHIEKYKYGMVFRCVSLNDSLNFRPVLYAYKDIIPFLDYNYDPTYLQIPKHIQDKLVVRSGQDINQKIKYFNENPNERLTVLNELKELFKINDYIIKPNEMINEQIKNIIEGYKI